MARMFLKKDLVLGFIDGLTEGQIFSVVFEKRDGTLRRMQCKQGVTKFLKGGEYKGTNPDIVRVFDTEAAPKEPMLVDGKEQRGDYRSFDATKVIRIRGGGSELKATGLVVEDPVFNARGERVKV